MTGPRPSAPATRPAIDQRNAAAAPAAAQPPIAPAVSSMRPMNYAEATRAAAARSTAPSAPAVPGAIPGYDKMSFEQRRLAQDQQIAARRGGR
jgi:hypothetical protein